jgi:hypothetical protein
MNTTLNTMTTLEVNGIYIPKDNKYHAYEKIVKMTSKFVFFMCSDENGSFEGKEIIYRLGIENYKKTLRID